MQEKFLPHPVRTFVVTYATDPAIGYFGVDKFHLAAKTIHDLFFLLHDIA